MRTARILSLFCPVAMVALAALPRAAVAQDTSSPGCEWEIEYSLAASLKLTDTPMGQGDGVYPIGPGKVVLRYQNVGGRPGGEVKMLQYRMREYLKIKSRTLFWSTLVTNDSYTAGTPNACSIVAEGAFDGVRTIRWRTPVSGYHTDGMLTCEGSLCGKFGAPPPGRMPLHIGPGPVSFSPFVFAADGQTFTMATTHVSKTDMPKESGEVALAGREVRRACVPVAVCAR
jgi:hypothetical protein